MVSINNSQVVRDLADITQIQQVEGVPAQLSTAIAGTIELNPYITAKCLEVRNQTASNATSGTLLTTDSNKSTYLVSCSLGVIKDALSPSTESSILTTINGTARRVIMIPSIATTAQNDTVSMSFPRPLKIDKGVTVTVTNSSATATIKASATIAYFEVDE